MTKKKISKIDAKIALFIKEAGDKSKYNVEQQKIYTAFTKKTGKPVKIEITDCEGVSFVVKLDPETEVQKILIKHYCTNNGTVYTKDILCMFDIIRTGSKYFNKGNYIYTKKYNKKGHVYFLVVKLFSDNKEAILKSFYSNAGYE